MSIKNKIILTKAGLACIAFGPECAAGIALGCAASATFY